MLPASMVATELHVPLGMTSDQFVAEAGRRLQWNKDSGKKVLIIDDSVAKGGSMAKARAQVTKLMEDGIIQEAVYAAVYVSRRSTGRVDIYGSIMGAPRIFEWNLFNSGIARKSMFDMDGVICCEPGAYDDDGPKYRQAIANARPLHIPAVKIRAICTGRIERWRKVTETWLKRHGVKYGDLIMNPAATAVVRRKKNNVPEIKGLHYKSSKAVLFIESSRRQAARIAKISGKSVLSLEDRKIYK